jgi:hypothetical protein
LVTKTNLAKNNIDKECEIMGISQCSAVETFAQLVYYVGYVDRWLAPFWGDIPGQF